LPKVRTAFERLDSSPFGIATTRDGRWAFVDEIGGHLAVFSDAGFVPRLVRTIDVPQDSVGNSLTADGRYLLVADGGDGASVVSVARAESGAQHPVLGTLQESESGHGGGAIEVASSPDGRYAFVSIEYGARVAVYDLRAALADGFRRSSFIGSVPLGQAVVGMAVSPDGRWLYATSELAGGGQSKADGTLSVISLADAERRPAQAVLATVLAHCSPVRVAVSADGQTVWVTARESDQLIGFSAHRLLADPAHALVAAVRVGESPVGLALVHGARQIVVADSDRFSAPGATTALTVVDANAALAHRPAILGNIRAGGFPREMALEPNGNILLVGNFGSDQLEAVAVDTLR
jgi:DNA-binding beta-propeller fold protein YncE